jgi:2-oxoglutarate ferredoxin oxidoreductase subunit alpha
MIHTRARKVAGIARDIPPLKVDGPATGRLLVLSWGGTCGVCATAVRESQLQGIDVAHAHLRHLNPFPSNLGEVLRAYDRVLVPELNLGQLRQLVRAEFLIDAIGLNKVQGKPFTVAEVMEKIATVSNLKSQI